MISVLGDIEAMQKLGGRLRQERLRRKWKSIRAIVRFGTRWKFADYPGTHGDGQGGEWLASLLEYLRGNCERVITELDGFAGLKVTRPQATYLAWIDCRTAGLEHPQRFFEEAGVGLSDGADFGLPGFVRLNFGCPRAILDQALARMRAALSTN